MKRNYKNVGIFDFTSLESFSTELGFEELISVNGGCGGGGSRSGGFSGYSGSCGGGGGYSGGYSSSYSYSSSSSSCGGGSSSSSRSYSSGSSSSSGSCGGSVSVSSSAKKTVSSVTGSCGGSSNISSSTKKSVASVSGSCGGSVSTKPLSASVLTSTSGSCGGGGSSSSNSVGWQGHDQWTLRGNNESSSGSCGGGGVNSVTPVKTESELQPIATVAQENSKPKYQTPSDPNDFHCDIIAYNKAIDRGVKNPGTWDGNWKNTDMIFNENYKDIATDAPLPGSKGYIIFDWASDGLGSKDHFEYYEASADGSSYTVWENDGFKETRVKEYIYAEDKNGRGGTDSTAVFVPLY